MPGSGLGGFGARLCGQAHSSDGAASPSASLGCAGQEAGERGLPGSSQLLWVPLWDDPLQSLSARHPLFSTQRLVAPSCGQQRPGTYMWPSLNGQTTLWALVQVTANLHPFCS